MTARDAMEIWYRWVLQNRIRGYASTDSLQRAAEHARGAIRTDGIARRRRGQRALITCRETRAQPRSRIPHDLDAARIGPRVGRLLDDLHRESYRLARVAWVVQIDTILARHSLASRASYAAMSASTFKRLRNIGFRELERGLQSEPI